MPPPLISRGRLFAWVLVGVALDAAALAGVWVAIDAIGPLDLILERWLDLVGLVAVPWHVHVVALSLIFGTVSSSWLESGLLLARGAVFTVFAGVCIAMIGFPAFWLTGMIWFIVLVAGTGGRLLTAVSPTWGHVITLLPLIAATAIAGAAIGCLLHVLRAGNDLDERGHSRAFRSRQPRFRSDVLGGATAGFLIVGGTLVALWLGLFSRPVDFSGDGMHTLAAAPQFPSTMLIGTLALLPHLVMTGIDALTSDRARERTASPAQESTP